MDPIDLYLVYDAANAGTTANWYENTKTEEKRLQKFMVLWSLAKNCHDQNENSRPEYIKMLEKSYEGILNALEVDKNNNHINNDFKESYKKSRNLKKLTFEIIESIVDPSIPYPKMTPRHKDDVILTNETVNFLNFIVDRNLSENVNGMNERSTLVKGTSWLKIGFDSRSSDPERGGDITLEHRSVEQCYPQPGITIQNYEDMEWFCERTYASTASIYNVYNRLIGSTRNVKSETVANRSETQVVDMLPIVNVYYKGKDGIVGLFSFCEATMQVICDDENWQMKKIRKCTKCQSIIPQACECPVCGSHSFRYEPASKNDILTEDLEEVYNQYKPEDLDNEGNPRPEAEEQQTAATGDSAPYQKRVFATAGTSVPKYFVRQIPFVPRVCIERDNSIYGISFARQLLENQDSANKIASKMERKVLKAKTYVSKMQNISASDDDDDVCELNAMSPEDLSGIRVTDVAPNFQGEQIYEQINYQNARNTVNVTDAWQGKSSSQINSGKQAEILAQGTAGALASVRMSKRSAWAGVYKLLFKYALAFTNEDQHYVLKLPNGKEKEMTWNKYQFLRKTKNGQYYYLDDFAFSIDSGSGVIKDQQTMWELIGNDYINGRFGQMDDPRARMTQAVLLEKFGYPTGSEMVSAIKEQEQHLPPQIEQLIMSNPEILQIVQEYLGAGSGNGKPGPQGNGNTHAANIAKTNNKNATAGASENSQVARNVRGGK